jgi:hypothetical protein
VQGDKSVTSFLGRIHYHIEQIYQLSGHPPFGMEVAREPSTRLRIKSWKLGSDEDIYGEDVAKQKPKGPATNSKSRASAKLKAQKPSKKGRILFNVDFIVELIVIPDDSFVEVQSTKVKPLKATRKEPSKPPSPVPLPNIVYQVFIKRNGKPIPGFDQKSISADVSYSTMKAAVFKYVNLKLKSDVLDAETHMTLGCSWISASKSPLKPLLDAEYGNFNDEDAFDAVRVLIRGSMKSRSSMILSIIAWIEFTKPSAVQVVADSSDEALERVNGSDDSMDEEERMLAAARKVAVYSKHSDIDFNNGATSKASFSTQERQALRYQIPRTSRSLALYSVRWLLFPIHPRWRQQRETHSD